MDQFDVKLLSDITVGGVRRTSFQTCGVVCSVQIDIETEGDVIRSVAYTKGCQGNTAGLSKLCEGMKVKDVIERLEGIDCKGRGTSCPDQLARALKSLS
ncbi:MAG: TIGR03905 family TSCPD domain-containing protein [Bacteroidales bacterium]|nr:TIGR03905 family TSCPD domain-containing protein [Bacteroidales bacterium]